jgi:UDP-GlcNAc:undecaprenyl-phosphate/decaprenyl-phosphate GlcNAc-1-phosphate transferase
VSAYLAVFVVAGVVTAAATPLVIRFVVRVGAIYQPNDRTVHRVPRPTMGGVAMYLGVVVALVVASFVPTFSLAMKSARPTLVTCTLMLGLGLIDDTWGVTALTKFVAQVFIAGVLVLFGVQFHYFWLPGLHTFVLSGDLGVIVTIAWAVAVSNAVNLVDGLDGLAAGMVAIAAAAFFVYIVRSGGQFGFASDAAMLAAITCGVSLGFLPWNFYPAKIFMGDAGSMLLGMLLAITTIQGVGNNLTPPTAGDIAAVAFPAIAVPILVLLIPFLDVLLAIARRTRRGVGIGHADKEHLHHHLMDIAHGHRQAVSLMYLWSALVSGSALAVGLIDERFAVALILAGTGSVFFVTALPRMARRRGPNGRTGLIETTAAQTDAQPGNVSDRK